MHFGKFSFGTLQIDGRTYEQDVVIDHGEICKRKKTPSKKFRDEFGRQTASHGRNSDIVGGWLGCTSWDVGKTGY